MDSSATKHKSFLLDTVVFFSDKVSANLQNREFLRFTNSYYLNYAFQWCSILKYSNIFSRELRIHSWKFTDAEPRQPSNYWLTVFQSVLIMLKRKLTDLLGNFPQPVIKLRG